ncbi:MAG: C4-dicarboxylate ABC transporter [Clostridium sp.]
MIKEISVQKVKADAEDFFKRGEYYCSEAIVASIKKNFEVDMPGEMIAMASGEHKAQCVRFTGEMAMMILAGYLKPYSASAGVGLWWLGVIIHVGLIILYTKNFIVGFNINKIFPSTFIVYVGIAAASITAPAFGLERVGQGIFWFALAALIVLVFVIGYRVFVVKGIPEPAMPTMVIFAAPAALTLAAYLNSFTEKNISMIYFLAVLVGVLYVVGLLFLAKGLTLKFYPSYAAFTFPMVISAIAIKGTNVALMNSGKGIAWLQYVVKVQEFIATIIVIYVLVRFIIFIFAKDTIKVTNQKVKSS